jgi:hypothetical protein
MLEYLEPAKQWWFPRYYPHAAIYDNDRHAHTHPLASGPQQELLHVEGFGEPRVVDPGPVRKLCRGRDDKTWVLLTNGDLYSLSNRWLSHQLYIAMCMAPAMHRVVLCTDTHEKHGFHYVDNSGHLYRTSLAP